ncbi:uncharacterized protein BX663DRAFT_512541 [Cokeromyces recurvatus]|uniref:uncharacterized protein n=1 Tax=Cokeromyces recurvatus TaxID=90255 RepID=UPI0022201E85|nr:uncharacterized protein BX663DRAFT_512541 [Cokeromyces recurvatus]KAI7901828.1 hypothetical protein BX663DRAFT_512541 [Cokeromyces recurvatus]
MIEDNEWHTVTSHKTTHPNSQANSSPSSNTRRKSKHKIPIVKQQQQQQPQKQHATSKSHKDKKTHPHSSSNHRRHHAVNHPTSNPFHAADDDDSDEEEENDEQIDPIDLPVPPYHTTIVISCPFQGCNSPIPFVDTTSLVKHLKDDHQLVFKNLHHMYMALDTYLSRWAKEFENKSISEIGELDTNNNVYVINPEKCALDKKIREDMQRAKLNEVLKTQQNERENDSKVPRKCLFCKIIGENRTTLFKHMFSEHNFNIGLPDNLVYVNEFLDTLEGKLSKLQCLYCEKTFTSPAVLRKHMRKKKHFKIAAKNRQYDRFYVINYLEPGKNWESFEHDTYDSDDDKQDDSWADWEEDVQESTMCLFDTQVLPSPKEALDHMKKVHHFNLSELRKTKGLDFYQVIVLINYIRHQSSNLTCFSCEKVFDNETELADHYKEGSCITKFVPMDAPFWKDPRFLIPTYENDPLLTGFEEEENEEEEEEDLKVPDIESKKKYLHQMMEKSLSVSEQ